MVLSIENLPVEIMHRIFDSFDAETLIFSIRPVSRFFRSVVITYHRYILNFKSISKAKFYAVSQLINPQNIISLILSNDDRTSYQIDLFIWLVHLQKLIRLRSLTLVDIDENQLNLILKQINFDLLISFSFNIVKYENKPSEAVLILLSLIIAQSTLRKLDIDIATERMLRISWPINCTIQYLTLNNSITIDCNDLG